MKEPLNVLSLFDGMSCGCLALAEANIPVAQYHASEVDKFAIQVATANWPDTLQLGSVVNVTVTQHYDLLIGGSPCQSFSFAGKRKGMATKDEQEILTLDHYLQLKSDGYEFEGQSYLFWEYVRILAECRAINPNIKFMLENVVMAAKWEAVITNTLGVKPIKINSALVSAQNRERLYWTNIGLQPAGLFGFEESIITQPADRGILLKDILQTNVPEKYYVSNALINKINKTNNAERCFTVGDKSLCLAAGYYKQGRDNQYIKNVIQLNPAAEFGGQPRTQNWVYSTDGISPALMAQMSCGTHAILEDTAQCVVMRGRAAVLTPKRTEYGKQVRKAYEAGELKTERKNIQQLEPRNDGKTNTLTSVQKDNLVIIQSSLIIPEANKKGYTIIKPGQCFDFENPNSTTRRGRLMIDKSNCMMAKKTDFMQFTSLGRIRRLTPTECERLQTVPDGYTAHVSDTQRYKMLGNGWTIKVIAHIFSYL